MPSVIYEGPTQKGDLTTVIIQRDESGKPHRLVKGHAADVPDDLAALLLGDDAPAGHKFSAADEPAEGGKKSKAQTTSGGGPGGTGNATGGGTATGTART